MKNKKKTRNKIAMIFEMTPIWSTNFFLFCIFCLFKRSQIFYKKKKLCVNKVHRPLKFISKKQWPKNNFHHSMPVTAQVTVSKCLLTVNSYTYLIRGWDAFLMIRVDASRPRPKYDFGLFPPSPLQTSSIQQHSRPKRIFILSKLTF